MSAHDRPTASELTLSVREFLESEILPTLDDRRLRYRVLVAMNALAIVAREAPDAPRPDPDERAHRIRSGDLREGDLEAIKDEVVAKLRVASPRFLEDDPPA